MAESWVNRAVPAVAKKKNPSTSLVRVRNSSNALILVMIYELQTPSISYIDVNYLQCRILEIRDTKELHMLEDSPDCMSQQIRLFVREGRKNFPFGFVFTETSYWNVFISPFFHFKSNEPEYSLCNVTN